MTWAKKRFTIAPMGVWDNFVPTGADNRHPREYKKTKQARGKRSTALDTGGRDLQFLQMPFLGQVKNDVTGVKEVQIASLEDKFFLPITFELTELEKN